MNVTTQFRSSSWSTVQTRIVDRRLIVALQRSLGSEHLYFFELLRSLGPSGGLLLPPVGYTLTVPLVFTHIHKSKKSIDFAKQLSLYGNII